MNIVVFPAAECHIDSHVTFCTKVFIILSMHKTTPWHGGCVSALCAHCEEFCIRRRCLQRPLTYDFYAPLAIYFLTILSTFKNANYFDNESIILWVSSHQLKKTIWRIIPLFVTNFWHKQWLVNNTFKSQNVTTLNFTFKF